MPNLDLSELEKEFAISFSSDELRNAKTIGDIKEGLRAKGVAL